MAKKIVLLPTVSLIIENPDSERIVKDITGKNQCILSQRLSAQFIAQLSFNDLLLKVIKELTSAYGSEFNLIDTKKRGITAP